LQLERLTTTAAMLSIQPFDAALGAEINGLDLAESLDDRTFAAVERAYNEHSLLLFRNQQLTPEQHIAFSKRFGDLQIHVLDQWCHPEHPELLIVSNIKDGERHVGIYNAGRYWHTDLSYMQAPSRGSLLYALEIPTTDGRALGDTLFASTAAAYDALSESMQKRIADLRATFSLAHQRAKLLAQGDTGSVLTEEQLAKTPVATHRIVHKHPVTGRTCLFVNEGHAIEILDLPSDEGAELLQELCEHSTQPEFVYRHRWAVGDLLMWDNLATQHLAIFDYALPQRRYLLRTTLEGVPIG
jgi:taurine dioxygenase